MPPTQHTASHTAANGHSSATRGDDLGHRSERVTQRDGYSQHAAPARPAMSGTAAYGFGSAAGQERD